MAIFGGLRSKVTCRAATFRTRPPAPARRECATDRIRSTRLRASAKTWRGLSQPPPAAKVAEPMQHRQKQRRESKCWRAKFTASSCIRLRMSALRSPKLLAYGRPLSGSSWAERSATILARKDTTTFARNGSAASPSSRINRRSSGNSSAITSTSSCRPASFPPTSSKAPRHRGGMGRRAPCSSGLRPLLSPPAEPLTAA